MQRLLAASCLLVCIAAVFTACSDNSGAVSAPTPTPQAVTLVYDQLRTAFLLGDRTSRRTAVLSLTRNFLSDIEARQVDDDAASSLLTNISLAAKPLLDNPAVVRRQDGLAVVGFPDGLGLFLYDLSMPVDTPPLELSPWTAGLSTVQVTWRPGEVGVLYFTVGADSVTTAHFVLAEQSRGDWRVGWFGDENPDWWFNVRNASVTVSPDLQTLTIVGESDHNSAAFDEPPGAPRRSFAVEWRRMPSGYAMSPQPASDSGRTAWLWQTAVPSSYATLVEFVERVRIGDKITPTQLVTDPEIVTNAFAYGLNFPENRFLVTASNPDSITIRSVRGTFVVGFKPPAEGADRPWLISSLAPVGAIPPTP